MIKSKGLEFKKFDLHIHTPASFDFTDKNIKPEDIIQESIKKGLTGIAITDHNTGEYIDLLKEKAKNTSLTVFPGVEIYCTGGKSGIHITGILDPEKGKKHIDAILSKLDINPDDFGTKKAVTHHAPYTVIDTITKEPYCGIAILAHSTSSKGVLHDITGETRTKIFTHPGLLAVETSITDFQDEEKKKSKKRVIDILDGNDVNYCNRKMAVILSSDSKVLKIEGHSLAGIGSQFTYLKVPEDVKLESIRQCFIDRDVRIRQSFEDDKKIYPYIESVKIDNGFFKDEEVIFHSGLNSIIGGKGAGKSLLIEFLRFVANKEPTQQLIKRDHERKLEKRLERYGSVSLIVIDETGNKNSVNRTYNPTQNNPYENQEQQSYINTYNILFLSQNEVINIAEDEILQLAFIDQFFDFKHYQYSIQQHEDDLKHLDKLFANILRSTSLIDETENQLNIKKKEIEKLNTLLANTIYDSYQILDAKNNILISQENELDEIDKIISDTKETLENYTISENPKAFEKDIDLINNNSNLKTILNVSIDKLREILSEIETTRKIIENRYKNWIPAYLSKKTEYETYIKNSGGEKKDLESRRALVSKEISDLESRLSKLKIERGKLRLINQQREEKIKSLMNVYKEYSKERKRKCKIFVDQSNTKLKIILHESTNIDQFRDKLVSLKRGSYLKDEEIELICKNTTPYDFILNLLRYDASKNEELLDKFRKTVSIGGERLKILFDFLLNQFEFEELLQLQYIAIPQDRPEIKYLIAKEYYAAISDISIGQKCTAMLMMALSEGNFPIIIDQPEDSLDVKSIWEDMCVKIRCNKTNRQFIFTTHNSSLAVASDTDKFHIIPKIPAFYS